MEPRMPAGRAPEGPPPPAALPVIVRATCSSPGRSRAPPQTLVLVEHNSVWRCRPWFRRPEHLVRWVDSRAASINPDSESASEWAEIWLTFSCQTAGDEPLSSGRALPAERTPAATRRSGTVRADGSPLAACDTAGLRSVGPRVLLDRASVWSDQGKHPQRRGPPDCAVPPGPSSASGCLGPYPHAEQSKQKLPTAPGGQILNTTPSPHPTQP
ncbi:hypothetical protein AAFF_G00377820 [Aldrovandia affinis]|uniref:Uncharacterized protein n=1 Tax=Aldrovandia affinis TaxID=143900 RepID=A0AAD7SI05_9TELE|nr:hypothetical protein AAFF_G00377820 [Aldrovandia affinis]